jgi:hypothetical protein
MLPLPVICCLPVPVKPGFEAISVQYILEKRAPVTNYSITPSKYLNFIKLTLFFNLFFIKNIFLLNTDLFF